MSDLDTPLPTPNQILRALVAARKQGTREEVIAAQEAILQRWLDDHQRSLAQEVYDMLEQQRVYFKTRASFALEKSRQLETALRKRVRAILPPP